MARCPALYQCGIAWVRRGASVGIDVGAKQVPAWIEAGIISGNHDLPPHGLYSNKFDCDAAKRAQARHHAAHTISAGCLTKS